MNRHKVADRDVADPSSELLNRTEFISEWECTTVTPSKRQLRISRASRKKAPNCDVRRVLNGCRPCSHLWRLIRLWNGCDCRVLSRRYVRLNVSASAARTHCARSRSVTCSRYVATLTVSATGSSNARMRFSHVSISFRSEEIRCEEGLDRIRAPRRILGTCRFFYWSMASSQLIEQVDNDDRPIGVVPRSQLFQRRVNFRVAHILVFDSNDRLLIRKLAPTRDRDPGAWAHRSRVTSRLGRTDPRPQSGRLREELGITDTRARVDWACCNGRRGLPKSLDSSLRVTTALVSPFQNTSPNYADVTLRDVTSLAQSGSFYAYLRSCRQRSAGGAIRREVAPVALRDREEVAATQDRCR